MKHPIQPIYKDEYGTLRFKQNSIVLLLLDNDIYDMNDLANMNFSAEDREQFAQLIGYSLSGFAELPYVSDEVYDAAAQMAETGESEEAARNNHLRGVLDSLRKSLGEAAEVLFGIHPDDLKIR